MVVRSIEGFEFRVGGQIVWKVENLASPSQGTVTIHAAPQDTNPLISEGVRRVVAEYGEAIRRLSSE